MGGSRKAPKPAPAPAPTQNNNLVAQQSAQQSAMQQQMDQARQAQDAERKRQEVEEAERIRQQNIQAENQKAADIRRSAENQLQSNFNSAAQNQQRLDQQAAQNAQSTVGGSGYNIGTAQQQKIGAAGGVAGPASTNAPSSMAMGLPPILASNIGAGGTQQSTNRFTLPPAQGLQFGGI